MLLERCEFVIGIHVVLVNAQLHFLFMVLAEWCSSSSASMQQPPLGCCTDTNGRRSRYQPVWNCE